MHKIELKAAPEVAAIVRAADPSYRKRYAYLMPREAVELSGSYWSGGSRSTYAAVDLTTGKSAGAPQYDPPQFGGREPTVRIPEGVAIVQTGIFNGKPATAFVSVNPANMARLLGVKNED